MKAETPVVSASALSVIIPAYNEGSTLCRAVERLLKVDLPVGVEVIVVDDGSTDDGLGSISHLQERGEIRVVRHSRNFGKGAAIRTGVESATGDFITVLDADLEYDPQDFVHLLRQFFDHGASVAYGTRSFGAHSAYSFWYVVGNKVASLWAGFLFNVWISDIETCLKMARRETWRSLSLKSNGFGVEAEITGKLLKAGHRIFEVPVTYRARTREEGKKLKWTDGVLAMLILLRVRLFGR
jgi:glycosyltransferase involved in cell wall biosynthesis